MDKAAIPGREQGVTDWDCIQYACCVINHAASDWAISCLATLWNPDGHGMTTSCTEERQAYYTITKTRASVGLPRIYSWRMRLALRRAREHGVLPNGVLTFPREKLKEF